MRRLALNEFPANGLVRAVHARHSYASRARREQAKHESPDIVIRLRLACARSGMMEAGTCAELAQQLHAVENAIAGAKRELIHDQMENGLDEAMSSGAKSARAALAEFKASSKYL